MEKLWYEVTMSDEDIMAGKHMALQSDFTALFITSRAPKDAVMLSAAEDVPPNYPFFFSPGAARIAGNLIARYGGKKCPAPLSPKGFALLVGHDGWQATFFPSLENS